MSRTLTFLVILSILLIPVSVFANDDLVEIEQQEEIVQEAEVVQQVEVAQQEESQIPQSIQNNRFYIESIRLTKLAQDTYEYGDYEASAGFAEEAVRFTQLSDEFVSEKLIEEAKRLVDWAEFYNIAERHPHNVQLGKDHYENAVAFYAEDAWLEASDSAIKSIEVLSVLQAGTGTTVARTPSTTTTTTTTTAGRDQYTVRTWAVERDCFWIISGYDWVYGDPWKWRTLYEANKHKIPDPNNPDLIEPGTVLDIPR